MYCLLSIVVSNVPILLLTPFSSDRCFIFKIFFSPPLIVERVKLYHPKVRVMSRYGGQRRDLILEPVSGPISASLEGASIVARVLQAWTPLKGAVQPYAMLCRADGLKLYDDNGVHLKLGILMQPRSILNPLKTSGGQPVALGGFGVWLGGFFFGRF